jgi:glycosyltransferase involved in cell wall biosynthesis
VISLASGLPGFTLGVSGIYPDFSSSGDLQGLLPQTPGRLANWLPRIPRALLCFSRAWLVPQSAACVIYSGIYAPLAVSRQSQGQRIYYCHTPPRFAFDRQPEYLLRVPALLRVPLRWAIGSYRAAYLDALRSMDMVVVNSEHVRERLLAQTGIRARVIYPPIDTGVFRFIAQQDYYLSVGRLEPNKRIERIVQAFLGMPDKKLVVASGGSLLPALKAMAAGAANIRFVGWQQEQALAHLVGNAIAVIYVPMDEDFGMSAVEAMAAGKPVIGVDEGGLRESIVPGQTGILLPADPAPEAIATAIGQLTPAIAASMREACEVRARDFSRARFLSAFAEIIE